MSAEKNVEGEKEVVSQATAATGQRTTVRLDQVKFDVERFCHRRGQALQDEALARIADHLVLENGIHEPIEVWRSPQGELVLINGYLRVAAARLNARKNVPGFTPDMEVEATLVVGATDTDLLLRSVSGNEV